MEFQKDSSRRTVGWSEVVASIGLFLVVAVVIVLQVIFHDAGNTKLVTTLFSVLQFFFSILATFYVAKISFRRQSEEGQRRLAISSFRRMMEIEMRLKRLDCFLERTHGQGFETARELCSGIGLSIKSSIADWGDIIGDEIIQQQEIVKLNRLGVSTEEQSVRLKRLMSALPPSLAILSKQDEPSSEYLNQVTERVEELLDSQLGLTCHLNNQDISENTLNTLDANKSLRLNLSHGVCTPRSVAVLTAESEFLGVINEIESYSLGVYWSSKILKSCLITHEAHCYFERIRDDGVVSVKLKRGTKRPETDTSNSAS